MPPASSSTVCQRGREATSLDESVSLLWIGEEVDGDVADDDGDRA
jgi:hypothetical protein